MIVTDGKAHEVDSSEVAFRTASIMAFRQGKPARASVLVPKFAQTAGGIE